MILDAQSPRNWFEFGIIFHMIFVALLSELLRFIFHSLSSKILKISEINLVIMEFRSPESGPDEDNE